MVIEIPEQLQSPEFRFLILKSKDKVPIEQEWQTKNNYIYYDKELLEYIAKGGNYGIIGGFGNLVFIDADSKEVNDIASKLPETFTIKTGSPEEYKHHYFYITDSEMKPIRLSKEKIGDLGDIRSTGQYVVAPNCIHPKGGSYKVIKNIAITHISQEELKRAFKDMIDKNDATEKKEFIPDTTKRESIYINQCRALDFFRFNKVKGDVSKNNKLFRYLVDIAYNRGVSRNVLNEIIKCQGHNEGSINGWVKLAGEGKLEKSSCEKMCKYLTRYLPEEKKSICNLCEAATISNKIKGKKYDVKKVYKNVKHLWKLRPFFYDEVGIFWLWNKQEYKWIIVDDVDILNLIETELNIVLNAAHNHRYLDRLKKYGRQKKPKEAPLKWIQFKDKAFSLSSGKIYEVTPDYFFTNPIPWEIGETSETPEMDKLISEWVGKDYLLTVYEMLAYCCYRSYPIQLVFCLYGSGRNGKTKCITLIENFIGTTNICSSDFDRISKISLSRFETFKLYKKLACFMGETNFGVMDNSSTFKKLTGEDLIGIEVKGKTPFDTRNYAKIIIASNGLPNSDDTSDGFYRRWFILDFPNEFPEGSNVMSRIPPKEYNNLCRKVMEILPRLLKKGEITNQGTIEERKQRYIKASNPFNFFLEEHCYRGVAEYTRSSELYTAYVAYLMMHKHRVIKWDEFKTVLTKEGLSIDKTTKGNISDRYVETVAIKQGFKDLMEEMRKNRKILKNDNNDNNDSNITYPPKEKSNSIIYGISQSSHFSHFLHNYIKQHPKDNYEAINQIFGKEIIDKLLRTADLLESPSGTLKWND